jgi:hypothetical protein
MRCVRRERPCWLQGTARRTQRIERSCSTARITETSSLTLGKWSCTAANSSQTARVDSCSRCGERMCEGAGRTNSCCKAMQQTASGILVCPGSKPLSRASCSVWRSAREFDVTDAR